MSTIINIFTREILSRDSFVVVQNKWDFSEIKNRISARFGENLPKFVQRAWLKKSQEPYAFGCAHNIQYRAVKSRYWNIPIPFPMDMDSNSDVIGRQVIHGGTDPLAWMDLKYKVSFEHIKERHGKCLTIHTRSDLIAHDDYIAALDQKNHKVVMYLLDAVPSVLRLQEPGAPSNERRRVAIQRLRDAGIAVEVVHLSSDVFTFKSGASI